ncbi:histidine kinase-like ATPase [Rhizopus microsporus]|uniref:ATPase domain of HSP90 chaperone/DNA topoisomerase II/histidine kinase n=1 Tax=Rhizopus microsporus TaxID=58291 RepID=A0A1X0RMQ0_RHIZD|nr:ATPase domain of HSP90 chaperone/DNA topoisomerase II/histidine kinase [Rhizopus microsporus]
MENSLDAGSNHIHITIIAGDLELVKIKDDGHGIHFEDLPLVCERHATRKIKDFRDLYFLNAFRFLGEALVTISYVADVTVVSKTDKSLCGY